MSMHKLKLATVQLSKYSIFTKVTIIPSKKEGRDVRTYRIIDILCHKSKFWYMIVEQSSNNIMCIPEHRLDAWQRPSNYMRLLTCPICDTLMNESDITRSIACNDCGYDFTITNDLGYIEAISLLEQSYWKLYLSRIKYAFPEKWLHPVNLANLPKTGWLSDQILKMGGIDK